MRPGFGIRFRPGGISGLSVLFLHDLLIAGGYCWFPHLRPSLESFRFYSDWTWHALPAGTASFPFSTLHSTLMWIDFLANIGGTLPDLIAMLPPGARFHATTNVF